MQYKQAMLLYRVNRWSGSLIVLANVVRGESLLDSVLDIDRRVCDFGEGLGKDEYVVKLEGLVNQVNHQSK